MRGLYLSTLTEVEINGLPINYEFLKEIEAKWPCIEKVLKEKMNSQFNIFKKGSFDFNLFNGYLSSQGIEWPRTPTGRLKTDRKTFKDMSENYPQLDPLREAMKMLNSVGFDKLTIGDDKRHRSFPFPFGTKTGRNNPSSNKNIFGLAKVARFLIQPEFGNGIAYIDYNQQEYGMAAA